MAQIASPFFTERHYLGLFKSVAPQAIFFPHVARASVVPPFLIFSFIVSQLGEPVRLGGQSRRKWGLSGVGVGEGGSGGASRCDACAGGFRSWG